MTDGGQGTAGRGTVVVVPTYDESLTLPGTLERLRRAVSDADVLVVDDGSPDGTGDLAERIAVNPAATRKGPNGM